MELKESLYPVLAEFASLAGIIRPTAVANLEFVPAHIRLSGVDLELAQALDNRAARLRKALENTWNNESSCNLSWNSLRLYRTMSYCKRLTCCGT